MGGPSLAILHFTLVAACPADPAALLRESIEASKANAARAVNWLAREDIRRYDLFKKRKLLAWETYEASMIEGERYYRLVAREGKPLKKAEAMRERLKLEREAEYRRATPLSERVARPTASRFSMSIRHVLEHHELKCVGEDSTPEGRKYWILDTRLSPGAPLPTGRADMMLTGDATVWIDRETRLILKQELRVTRPGGGWVEGTQVSYESFWNGEVMLVQRIQILYAGLARGETSQDYSGYRKFASSSEIRFETGEVP